MEGLGGCTLPCWARGASQSLGARKALLRLVSYRARPVCGLWLERRQAGEKAGRPAWMQQQEVLKEAGGRKMERRERFPEKPQQTVSFMALFNELNLCFLNYQCFRGGECFVCSVHLIPLTPYTASRDK